MKYLVTKGLLLLVFSIPAFILVEDTTAEQIRDNLYAQNSVRDHRTPQRENTVVRVLPIYKVAWLKPTTIPDDLENWLNSRMRGYGLVAAARDDSSGRYNSFFKKLYKNETWNYEVRLVHESDIETALNTARVQNLELVTVTSAQHGPRGLNYICFFRKH